MNPLLREAELPRFDQIDAMDPNLAKKADSKPWSEAAYTVVF